MDSQTHQPAANNDDKRELYTLVREDRERIASLEGAVESLASSVESGFRNVQNQVEALGRSIQGAKPQVGVIAALGLSAAALIASLAGFALKSSVLPVQHDVTAIDRRLSNLEERMQVRYSDHDDVQDARIDENAKIIDEFNRLMLQNYVAGSIGAAKATHKQDESQ